MDDTNQVTIVGRLTRDAELKYTGGGTPVLNASIANNYSKKSGDRWEDVASFFDVRYFGKGAEAVNKYMTKGQQIAVSGELRQDRWEQDGQARSKVVINANRIQLLGGRKDSQGEAPHDSRPVQDRGTSRATTPASKGGDFHAPSATRIEPKEPNPFEKAAREFEDDTIPF